MSNDKYEPGIIYTAKGEKTTVNFLNRLKTFFVHTQVMICWLCSPPLARRCCNTQIAVGEVCLRGGVLPKNGEVSQRLRTEVAPAWFSAPDLRLAKDS